MSLRKILAELPRTLRGPLSTAEAMLPWHLRSGKRRQSTSRKRESEELASQKSGDDCTDYTVETPIWPRRIRIGASQYELIAADARWRAETECDGLCDFDQMKIYVVVEDRPLTEISNTLIHELLHVCYREWHIKPKCGEERTVTALGYALNAVLGQNPELVTILYGCYTAEEEGDLDE